MFVQSLLSALKRGAGFLKHKSGLDRAIAYTVLARLVGILGSTGTVLLIVHFLSPVEQGYYYALLSLVSLQAIFEMGFSFVVQQLAAHESVHLSFLPDGSVAGDAVAHARLASILQLTVVWYSRAAGIMFLILMPLGWVFFFTHRHASEHVAWQGPWTIAAAACAMIFLLAPFYSFLDGCGQVREVAGLRLAEFSFAAIMAWSAMISHHGLYAPAMVIVGQVIVGVIFLWRRRKLLVGLYRHPADGHSVSWRNEVWPFQWKIAVSWTCAYFTAQVFIPILFMLRGAVEAGQMGMSLSITSYLSVLMLAWISTKATPFGQMIARGRFAELDSLFFRALRQSLGLLIIVAAVSIGAVLAFQHLYPRLAARMVSPLVFALLVMAMLCSFVVQSLAIYLRSFKREPFLGLYLTTCVLTLSMVLLTAKHWGNMGVAVSYLVSAGIIGVVYAIQKFRSSRHLRAPDRALSLESESL